MIVRRDDHEGHLFDCGDVHSFMERAGLHATFADAGQADEVFLALRSFRHQCADRDRNHRAEMTDHGELILPWAAAMNIAVTSAHRALGASQDRCA